MPDIAASTVAVDLSLLEAPPVLRPLDFEQRVAALVADFKARCVAAGVNFDALLESDPVMKLLEELAYRDILGTAEVNDVARSLMLAYAQKGDLDHLAARMNVARLVVAAATADHDAVMEGDTDLRRRVQLAPERFPLPGRTAGGYMAITLAAAPSVKDVGLVKRDGGRVDVILLGRAGNGAVPDDVVQAVYQALQPDDATGLTDIISVASAQIITYSPTVTLRIRPGPDPILVKAAAEASIRAYAADRHRVGHSVYAGMIIGAAKVGAVENVLVDIDDVAIGPRQAPWLQLLTINVEVFG